MGGYSNGYFLLSGLDPNGQGIGGNTGGFTIGQDAVFGLKKAEAGSEYANILVIAQSTEGGKGLYTNEKNIQTGKNFDISVEYIFNFGLNTFNGDVVATLFDKNGQVKEDISEIMSVQDIKSFYGFGGSVTCMITQTIKGGDRIKMRYKEARLRNGKSCRLMMKRFQVKFLSVKKCQVLKKLPPSLITARAKSSH